MMNIYFKDALYAVTNRLLIILLSVAILVVGLYDPETIVDKLEL
jgi:hypothetical protein